MKPSDTIQARQSFWFKFLIILLFVCFALGFLIVTAVVYENHRGTRKWAEYRQQLEAQGEKLDMQAFLSPPLPATSNFASLQMVAEIFYSFRGPPGSVRLWGIRPTAMDQQHHKTTDIPKNTDRIKKTKMELWAGYYQNHTNYPQADAIATPAQKVITALGKFEPELKELREGAALFPQCQYPIDYQRLPDITLPHLSVFKGIIQVLNLRAQAFLENGNADAAFEDVKLGLFIMDTIKRDPILISHLVRNSLFLSIHEAFVEGLRQHAWKDAQLTWFQHYFETANFLDDYHHSMRGERNFGILMAQLIKQGGARDVLNRDISKVTATTFRLIPEGFINHAIYHIVRLYQDHTLGFVSLEKHAAYPDKVRQFQKTMDKSGRSYYEILAKLLVPAVIKTSSSFAQAQALCDTSALACAVERHRLAEGAVPETLDALIPKYLKSLPKDVIGGKPLKYTRLSNDEYLLYSVGWNGKDEKCQIAKDREKGDWGISVEKP